MAEIHAEMMLSVMLTMRIDERPVSERQRGQLTAAQWWAAARLVDSKDDLLVSVDKDVKVYILLSGVRVSCVDRRRHDVGHYEAEAVIKAARHTAATAS